MAPLTIRIYTIGYAHWSTRQVRELLIEIDGVLADVRLKPYSSKPGFSKGDLQAAFGERYRHIPAFGNVNYRGGSVQLKDPERGMQEMADHAAESGAIILMCGCADHRRCHRASVARYVAANWPNEARVTIEHRYPEGLTPEPSLFD